MHWNLKWCRAAVAAADAILPEKITSNHRVKDLSAKMSLSLNTSQSTYPFYWSVRKLLEFASRKRFNRTGAHSPSSLAWKFWAACIHHVFVFLCNDAHLICLVSGKATRTDSTTVSAFETHQKVINFTFSSDAGALWIVDQTEMLSFLKQNCNRTRVNAPRVTSL